MQTFPAFSCSDSALVVQPDYISASERSQRKDGQTDSQQSAGVSNQTFTFLNSSWFFTDLECFSNI